MIHPEIQRRGEGLQEAFGQTERRALPGGRGGSLRWQRLAGHGMPQMGRAVASPFKPAGTMWGMHIPLTEIKITANLLKGWKLTGRMWDSLDTLSATYK